MSSTATESGHDRLARLTSIALAAQAEADKRRFKSEEERQAFIKRCMDDFWKLRGETGPLSHG